MWMVAPRSGQHAAAQAYYVTALRCSASAANPLSGANVLAGMSWQATLTGNPTEALGLLDTAKRQVDRNASPKLRALLASRRARAHARAGDTRACGQALNEAEDALSASADGQLEPDWIYFFDEAELAAQAGSCWVDLRQPARARPLLDGALRSMGTQYVRDRTIYQARSAQTSYHSGELDLACAELTHRGCAGEAHRVDPLDQLHPHRSAGDVRSRQRARCTRAGRDAGERCRSERRGHPRLAGHATG